MAYVFKDWLSCPTCHERDGVKIMTHRTDVVLECYECGQISEYTIGKDVPVHELDTDAIVEGANEDVS